MKAAAAIPVTFGTAHDCLFEFGRLKAGETVLVQAGASGVESPRSSSPSGPAPACSPPPPASSLDRLKEFGLDEGIDYRAEQVPDAVMRLTGGKGVNLVVDSVGGATLAGSLASLAYRGRVSLVGNAGREPMRVDVSSLMGGNRSLSGVFLGAEIMTDRVHDMIQRLIDEAARGELKVLVDRVFPLSEAAAAHSYIESRQAVGRVVMVP